MFFVKFKHESELFLASTFFLLLLLWAYKSHPYIYIYILFYMNMRIEAVIGPTL